MSTKSTTSTVPLILTSKRPTDFIAYMLDHSAPRTSLIICSTREEFLAQLLRSATTPKVQSTSSTNSQSYDLLTPTLSLLSLSTAIDLAYCPTLQHLRAHLSSLDAADPRSSEPDLAATAPTSPRRNLLGLLNPISIHRSTSEFSAQGISRTFAAAVEAADRCGVQLVVGDCGEVDDDEDDDEDEDAGPAEHVMMAGIRTRSERDDGAAQGRISNVWDEEVPFLSGSIGFRDLGGARDGAGGGSAEGRGWTGRKVPVKRIVGRWCVFQR